MHDNVGHYCNMPYAVLPRPSRPGASASPTHGARVLLLLVLQVGWHAAKPHREAPEERFTLPHTDVTCKEGRTHATYYGYMTLL